MAVFNPGVPNTPDPNWLGWSKAISQPGADTSTGELLSTAGEGIKEGVKFAANAIDEGVKTIAYDATRKLQDEHISSLEKTDIALRVASEAGYPTGPGVPGGNATNRQSVYDAPPQEIAPADLKRLPADLSLLDNARANGKISPTAYEGRLVALAKDLRAKYPGQRDLIDEEISKVSQRDVANKYAQSILGDINSFATAGKEEDKQVRAQILKGMELGIPRMEEHMANYLAGRYGPPDVALPRIMAVIGPAHQLELQLKLSAARRAERKGSREDMAIDMETDAHKFMQGEATNTFNSINLEAGSPTYAQMSNAIRLHLAGKETIDELQARAFAKNIKGLEFEANKRADAFFNDTKGPDGRPFSAILGKEKVAEIKQAYLSQFDRVHNLLMSRDYGAAYDAMETIRAMGNEDVKTLLTNKEMGETLRMGTAVNKMGLPTAGEKWFQEVITKDGNLEKKYREFLKHGALSMAQPTTAEGTITTLKSRVEELKRRTEGRNTPAIAKTQDGLLNVIETIADPTNTDVESKRALARAAFSEGNIGLLANYDNDHYEHTPGGGRKFIPGKFSVFNRLFNEDMTKSMKQIGGPEWEQYKDIAKQMGFRELFGPTLKDLTRLGTSYPGIQIGWDTDQGKFIYKDVPVGPNEQFPATPTQRLAIKEKVDRINNNLLTPMNVLFKEEKTDPSAGILRWMKEFGVDVGKLPGIPEDMMKAIIKSKEEEGTARTPKFKEPPKSTPPGAYDGRYPTQRDRGGMRGGALPYDVEDAPSSGSLGPQGGSLSEFLRSPDRVVAAMKKNAPVKPAQPAARRSINLSDNNAEVVSVENVGPNEDINQVIKRRR